MSWEIYKHTNKTTGKSYIGMTCRGMKDRWWKHCHEARSGSTTHFHRALRKYGEDNWESEVIRSGLATIEEANQAEIVEIANYDSIANGYNCSTGGDQCTMSAEVVKEITRKIRKYHGTKKVSIYNVRTKEVKHGYLGDIEKELSLPASPFSDLVAGKQRSYHGWVIDTEENRKYKPIVRHWFYHETYGTDYASLDEMCRKYSNIISRGNLSCVIYGTRKSHQGWKLIKSPGENK